MSGTKFNDLPDEVIVKIFANLPYLSTQYRYHPRVEEDGTRHLVKVYDDTELKHLLSTCTRCHRLVHETIKYEGHDWVCEIPQQCQAAGHPIPQAVREDQ
ncbi:hypothetical protein EK21DRAFT_107321 [Setomelanomma holmii]|uniref:F-box domain-containing protein n=1 Tax=Setomelanomma holmii TaxID=210430 RepID=A0A9P4HLK7_9PLEO|nr:hypothetical protein EK21DRAFT_107321 [Setomelanomma holmii]